MPEDKIERALRLKYSITQRELADAMGVSRARLITIEQWEPPCTQHQLRMVQRGFENVIKSRQKHAKMLEQDYQAMRDRLMEPLILDGRDICCKGNM